MEARPVLINPESRRFLQTAQLRRPAYISVGTQSTLAVNKTFLQLAIYQSINQFIFIYSINLFMYEKINKMPEFYMIIGRKIFFPIFLGGGGGTCPYPLPPPPPYFCLLRFMRASPGKICARNSISMTTNSSRRRRHL